MYTTSPPNIKFAPDANEENIYQIDQGIVVVFPLTVDNYVLINANHSNMYRNQAGTVVGWPSYDLGGKSISPSAQTRVNLTTGGFSWLLYKPGVDLKRLPDAYTKIAVPFQNYYMCFQNLENKPNYFYCKITS